LFGQGKYALHRLGKQLVYYNAEKLDMRWLSSEGESEKAQENAAPPKNDRIRGEWLLLMAILIISGITAFLYVKVQLEEPEKYTGSDVVYVTPTPEPGGGSKI
jgi:hypothetical protein